MNRIHILILLLVISNKLVGQEQYAFIQTKFEFGNKDLQYSFKVNGVDVSESNKLYSVPINKIGLDTVEFSFNSNPVTFAIMKMQQDKTYDLISNPCSMYVIRPKEEPKQGMVQFRVDSKDTTSFLVSVDGLSERKVNRGIIDEFYYTPPSAMCQFSARSIVIKSLEGAVLQKIPFHFLHGELVGILYHENSNTVELNLYGYIRTQKDYRYKYDYENKE